MGLFHKKAKVSEFFSPEEIQELKDAVMPQILARLMDFTSRMKFESFVNMAGDSGKALNREGVSQLLTAAEGFAKADPSSAATLENGIQKMKDWLNDPSNH